MTRTLRLDLALTCLALLATPSAAGAAGPPGTRLALAAPSAADLARAAVSSTSADAGPSAGTDAAGAAGLSLLLPGLGQATQGHGTRAAIFLGIEGALWTTVAVSEIEHHLRTDAAREQAEVFAHVTPGDHSATFYRDVARLRSSDDYNALLRREARALYSGPDSLLPAYMDEYEAQNGYFGQDTWRWDTFSDFTRYGDLRHAAQNAMRRASFAIGGALANRLFAVIDATRGRKAPPASGRLAAPPPRLAVTTDPSGRTTCALVLSL